MQVSDLEWAPPRETTLSSWLWYFGTFRDDIHTIGTRVSYAHLL